MMSVKNCNGTNCHLRLNPSIGLFASFSASINDTGLPLKTDEIFYTVAHDSTFQLSVFHRVIEIVLSAIGIIFNGFFIVVMMNSSTLGDVKTTKFLMSLSISDLFVSGIVMVFSILVRTMPQITEEEEDNKAACWLWASVSMAACTASSLNVCAISIDRYMSISFPLHYENVITRCRINAVVISIWTISCSMAFLTLYLGFGDDRINVQSAEVETLNNNTAALPANSTYVTFINYCQELPSRFYIIAIVTLIVLLPCLVVIIIYLEIFRLVTIQLRVIKKEQACARRLTRIPKIRSRLSLLALHSSIMSDFEAQDQTTVKNTDPATAGNTTQVPRSSKIYDQSSEYVSVLQPESMPGNERYVKQHNQATNSASPSLKSAFINVCQGEEKQCQYIVTEHRRITVVGNSQDNDGIHSPDLLNTSRRSSLKSAIPTSRKTPRGTQLSSVNEQYILSTIKIRPPQTSFDSRPSIINTVFANLTHRMSLYRNPEIKAAFVLLLIAGTYVVCWLPFGIVSIMQANNPHLVSWTLREAFLWLAYSNSCWNPLIYALLNKTFRTSIYVFLAKHGCKGCVLWSHCRKKQISLSETSI